MTKFNIQDYDRYIVSFSDGKDFTATFLYLLDQGIPKDKIEQWRQEIDGREHNFFDWEVTLDNNPACRYVSSGKREESIVK